MANPMEGHTIGVLVADDHAIVRKGICALLATEPGITVVGEAEDGIEAIARAIQSRPDVILMDLVMPRMDGLEAIRQIKARWPEARILVLTSFSGEDDIFPAIKAGAQGYLLKDSGPDQLVEAIHQTHHGESCLHPAIARKLLQEISKPAESPAETDALTTREREVLSLVAQGQSNRQISEELSISDATVRSHVSNILTKLKLSSRTQAALYALREGLAALHDTGTPFPG